MKAPELLSPAGSLKALNMAFAYGADAVYAGQPRYSLRVRNNEFDLETIAKGIAIAHAQHKKLYIVANIAPHNAKLITFVKDMEPLIALQPDALIVSDPGVIGLLREHYPDMPLHLSVQANTMNWAAVKFWQAVGIERVILSRELGLTEIEEIKQRCPDMELEVFVHGALCMAYSGRCLISSYMNKRDPNQGACTNACRWKYDINLKGQQSDIPTVQVHEYVPQPASNFRADVWHADVRQTEQPDDVYPLEEDEHGSYLFNSRDLRAVHLVEKLTQIGVDSLKIEGRTKSPYYVGRTAQVYRSAIDAAVRGDAFDESLMTELDGLANRGYTQGFLQRHSNQTLQNYEQGHSIGQQQVVGEVIGLADNGSIRIDVKNNFALGDNLLLMTPRGNHRFVLSELFDLNGNAISVAPGSGHRVHISTGNFKSQVLTHLGYEGIEHAMLVKELPR